MGGDSGSPVVSSKNGGMLLGMHIAGGGNLAFMIPAWQLLNPARYKGVASSEVWELINP